MKVGIPMKQLFGNKIVSYLAFLEGVVVGDGDGDFL